MGKNQQEEIRMQLWQRWLLVITFGIIALVYLKEIRFHSMHIDEHEWLRRGLLLTQMYIFDHDFNNQTGLVYYRYFVQDMPVLTEIIYGLFAAGYYQKSPRDILTQSDFNAGLSNDLSPGFFYQGDNWWVKYGSRTGDRLKYLPASFEQALDVLAVGKVVNAIFALGTLLVVFYIGKNLGGFGVGYMALLITAINPLYYLVGRQAMLESIPLFWFCLSFGYYLKIISEKKQRIDYGQYLILGLWCGLGFASKLNGLGVYGVMVLASFLELIRVYVLNGTDWRATLTRLLGLGVTGVVTVSVFIMLNPLFWQRPWAQFKVMLNQRVNTVQQQTKAHGEIAYLNWLDQIGGMVRGVLLPRGVATTFSWKTLIGDLALFGLGIYRMLIPGKLRWLRGQFLMIVWLWAALICAYIKVPLDRYYVPVVPMIAVVQAFGIMWLGEGVRRWVLPKLYKTKDL